MKPLHLIVTVAAVLLGLGVSCTGFRKDEIACEQAVVHLSECCPDFDANKIDCSFSDDEGCGTRTTQYPAYSEDESACLKAKSCEDLVSKGYCKKAQNAKPAVDTTRDGGTSHEDSPSTCR